MATKIFDIDKESVAEPIDIILDGNTYHVGKVKEDLLENIEKMSEAECLKDSEGKPILNEKGEKTFSASFLRKQLSMFLEVDPEVLKDIDIRKIGKALKYIQQSMESSFKELKN